MNSKLRAMVVSAGVFLMGGVAYFVSTPQPAARTMLELKDAGVLLGQRVVQVCPERLTKQTIRRVAANQPGLLRPRQAYGIVAREARCFGDAFIDGGFGNCLRPTDGGSLAPFVTEVTETRYTHSDGGREWSNGSWPVVDNLDDGGVEYLSPDLRNDGGFFTRVGTEPKEPEVVVPSLRANLAGIDLDASVGADDGGDNDDVDDAYQYATTSCSLLTCTQFAAGVDAGTYVSPFAGICLGGLNRLALQPMPCMLPDPYTRLDGGWHEIGEVDCKFIGPFGLPDGGPRWNGYNARPREYAVGTQCLPSACVVVAEPMEWLKL